MSVYLAHPKTCRDQPMDNSAYLLDQFDANSCQLTYLVEMECLVGLGGT